MSQHRFRTLNPDSPAARARRAKYGSREHREAGKTLTVLVAAGKARCWRCNRPIPPGTPRGTTRGTWQVGHNDAGTRVMGPEHTLCNRRAAARKGNRIARARGNTWRPGIRSRVTPLDLSTPSRPICPMCRAPFTGWPGQTCCSDECSRAYRTLNQPGPTCPVRYANCKCCGAPFVQRRGNVFCSPSCRSQRWRIRDGNAGPTQHTCPECGVKFTARVYARYCSVAHRKRAEKRRARERQKQQAA